MENIIILRTKQGYYVVKLILCSIHTYTYLCVLSQDIKDIAYSELQWFLSWKALTWSLNTLTMSFNQPALPRGRKVVTILCHQPK
jgi:hypothetical protein